MAKSKNRQRDVLTPSLGNLLAFPQIRPAPVLLSVPSYSPQAVLDSGDRRFYQPDRSATPPHTPKRGASRVKVGRSFNSLAFANPKLVALCVRRKQRKEVLFAKRKTRAGSRGKKHRNFWSTISC